MGRPGLIVLAGPTASGKSDWALRVAERLGGMLVNADSMQLYRDLRILTARPSEAEEARAPHRLYGILDAAESGSVAGWLGRAGAALAEARAADRVPLVVGGSGLYIEALLDGISPVPEIPDEVRNEVRASYRSLGRDGLRRRLRERDPAMAVRLEAGDPQRVMRALEVVEATGRSLASWHDEPRCRLRLPSPVLRIALFPPRPELRERIAGRLRRMIRAGALAEVEALLARGLPRDLPLMRAVGVPALIDHLEGRLGLDEALEAATFATRRYAKRQVTWIRRRMHGFRAIDAFGDDLPPDIERLAPPVDRDDAAT